MTSLHISATGRGLNYLPEYYAQANGLFEALDLEVTAVACDPWTGVLDDLESGAADIALGGLWVPAMYAKGPRALTVFGQLNHQFPMAVLTREAVPAFGWDYLTGRTVLAPGAGGSAPFEFTAGLMREAGVDPKGPRFVRDLSTAMLIELFTAGLGDAIILDLLSATVLEQQGMGHIPAEHARRGGTMPNSVYYAKTERMDELAPTLTRFMTAIDQAMVALADTDVTEVLPLVTSLWPEVSPQALETATAKLLASQTWASTKIDRAASDRWMNILADGGLVSTAPSYDSIITTRITDAITTTV